MTIEQFQGAYCNRCGTQRCPADEEAIKTCGYWKQLPKLPKAIRVSATYEFTLEPQLLGLSEDCTQRELEDAADAYMNTIYGAIHEIINMPPDMIDTEVFGTFE